MGIFNLTPHIAYLGSFVILIGAGLKYALPLLLKSLDTYISDAQQKLEDASKYREDAVAFLNSCKRKHVEATVKAEKILQNAAQEVEGLKDHFIKELEEFESRQKKLAEEKITKIEETIIQDVRYRLTKETMNKVKENILRNL